jgi:hypothetical protein
MRDLPDMPLPLDAPDRSPRFLPGWWLLPALVLSLALMGAVGWMLWGMWG